LESNCIKLGKIDIGMKKYSMKVVVRSTKDKVPRLRDLLTLETSFSLSTFFGRRWTLKKVASIKSAAADRSKIQEPRKKFC
jgi:hypothetical protein